MKQLQIFGDSILRGVIYSAEKNSYHLSRDCRYSSLADCGVEVINNSKMGATIDKGARILRERLQDCTPDTLVLLEYGGNDCAYDWQKISEDPSGRFDPVTPVDAFLQEYTEAIRFAQRRGAKVAVSNLAPIHAEKYMNWISRGKSYENILTWLGDVAHLSRWQEYYSRLAERLALRTGCMLFDLRTAFLADPHFSRLISEDGIHPTQAGHDLVSAALRRFALSA